MPSIVLRFDQFESLNSERSRLVVAQFFILIYIIVLYVYLLPYSSYRSIDLDRLRCNFVSKFQWVPRWFKTQGLGRWY